MTLLTIAQNIASDAKTSTPSTIIGNSEEVAKQLLSSIKLSTKDLFEKHNWQVLSYEESFNTVPSQAAYDLPSDFSRISDDTFFNTTNKREVYLISPRGWRQESVYVASSLVQKYRIRQNKVEILPTPTAAEGMIYEYISNEVILDTNGSTKYTDWQADTDTCLINEDLVELGARWRFLRMQGKEYAEAKAEFDERFELIMGRDAGRGKVYPRNLFYNRWTSTLPQPITP